MPKSWLIDKLGKAWMLKEYYSILSEFVYNNPSKNIISWHVTCRFGKTTSNSFKDELRTCKVTWWCQSEFCGGEKICLFSNYLKLFNLNYFDVFRSQFWQLYIFIDSINSEVNRIIDKDQFIWSGKQSRLHNKSLDLGNTNNYLSELSNWMCRHIL